MKGESSMNDMGKSNSSAENQFIVIARTVSVGDKYQDCSVIKADAQYLATHNQVFGPASCEECEKWLRENCECPKECSSKNASGDEVNNG